MISEEQLQSDDIKSLSQRWLVLCAVLVGLVAGIGAVAFRMMIGFVHNLLYYGELDVHYDANYFAHGNPWGWGVIFVPVVGSIAVTWLVKTFAPEAKGHGVPEVMDAIYNKSGLIRPMVAVIKSLASAISIGSGGSVGREGPIAQIGAAFASTLGQLIPMPARQRVILIAAGAAAGIAATFNAPVGGLAFAMELMLVSINASSVALVVISTIIATYIGRIFLGLYPAFNIPALAIPDWHLAHSWLLLMFVPFGILCGLASALLVRSIYWAEDLFDAIPINQYLRHMLGMFILGLMFYAFYSTTGHYFVDGVGYATIVAVLSQTLSNPWFLLLLFVGKLVATNLTLGSGASGGVFSPSLFLGATLGSAFGTFVQFLFPHTAINIPQFAIAGMAAIVGGSTGAVMTAIVMVFELTRDYSAMLPIMLAAALSFGVRYFLCHESIYTLKLLRRGVTVAGGLQAALLTTRTAARVMTEDFRVCNFTDLIQGKVEDIHENDYIIVENQGEIVGLLKSHYLAMGVKINENNYQQLIDTNFLMVKPSQEWPKILRAINRYNYQSILVSHQVGSREADTVIGVITTYEIVRASTITAKLLH